MPGVTATVVGPLSVALPTLATVRVKASPLSDWLAVAGAAAVIRASGAGVKLAALTATSPKAVTRMGPAVTPEGTVAVIWVRLLTV